MDCVSQKDLVSSLQCPRELPALHLDFKVLNYAKVTEKVPGTSFTNPRHRVHLWRTGHNN